MANEKKNEKDCNLIKTYFSYSAYISSKAKELYALIRTDNAALVLHNGHCSPIFVCFFYSF